MALIRGRKLIDPGFIPIYQKCGITFRFDDAGDTEFWLSFTLSRDELAFYLEQLDQWRALTQAANGESGVNGESI